MPRYKNISNKTYCNTKYNVFNINPGDEFDIDKEIDSQFLQKIDDVPTVKYDGDLDYSLSPGELIEIDLLDKIEIGVYPVNIPDGDFVEISVNQEPDLLSDEDKILLIQSMYFLEKHTQLKGYNKIYLKAPSTNVNIVSVKVVYRYK